MLFKALLLCALPLLVSGMSDKAIHFDNTDGSCGENSTVVSQCTNAYSEEVTIATYNGNFTDALNCMLMTDTLACIETALCHCNYSGDHPQLELGFRSSMTLIRYYNNLTQCANETFGRSIMADVIGPIDVEEGVNCAKYNRTAGNLALTLAVAQIPAVQQATLLCPGVRACYDSYDRGMEMAIYRKQWPEFCGVTEQLVECLVNTSCNCNMETHELIVSMVETERQLHGVNCGTLYGGPSFQEIGITCPGKSRCESPDPNYRCLAEFQEAFFTGLNDTEYCMALHDLTNCTEELACECGFYQDPGYYRSLSIDKFRYGTYQCEQITGIPFPNHTDLNCGVDDRFTYDEKILSVALADPVLVQAEEARCRGIAKCYVVANAKSTEAYRMKDLTSICLADSERISCVENAYCHCGLLSDPDVIGMIYQYRVDQGNLCYSVADFPPLTRCRGPSSCQRKEPLKVCEAELVYDSTLAGDSLYLQCEARKFHYTCVEEIGCACGMIDNGKSLKAEVVYNLTTIERKNYYDNGCSNYTGEIIPKESGIECKGDHDTIPDRKLVLAYANSEEVADLSSQCSRVKDCFSAHDTDKAAALQRRSYSSMCTAQEKFIHCADDAFCQCRLNGTAKVETYVTAEIMAHRALCRPNELPIRRKPCVLKDTTGTAVGVWDPRLAVGLLLTALALHGML